MNTKHSATRFAIKMVSPDGLVHWHCQGNPKSNSFDFAILYASMEHLTKAMKQWKFRTAADRLIQRGWVIEPVTVRCAYELTVQQPEPNFIEP